MSPDSHWDLVYRNKSADGVSWYQPHLAHSLNIIRSLGLPPDARIIDVGGGASTLVDDLVADGFSNLLVVDLSEHAVATARKRLNHREERVDWLVSDITTAEIPGESIDLWHDRAVFHFLTDAGQRQAYVHQAQRSIRPGGHIIVATFGPDGPERCSGLEVVRYSHSALHGQFGTGFELVAKDTEKHVTPAGNTQDFIYCYCRRTPGR